MKITDRCRSFNEVVAFPIIPASGFHFATEGKFVCLIYAEKYGGGSGEGNSMLKTMYAGLWENKPNLGSDSFSYCDLVCEKARKTLLFSSCGEYA
jgi:hypothetical protein